jgi:hypothetical protein
LFLFPDRHRLDPRCRIGVLTSSADIAARVRRCTIRSLLRFFASSLLRFFASSLLVSSLLVSSLLHVSPIRARLKRTAARASIAAQPRIGCREPRARAVRNRMERIATFNWPIGIGFVIVNCPRTEPDRAARRVSVDGRMCRHTAGARSEDGSVER